jgi:hypothetical protein
LNVTPLGANEGVSGSEPPDLFIAIVADVTEFPSVRTDEFVDPKAPLVNVRLSVIVNGTCKSIAGFSTDELLTETR